MPVGGGQIETLVSGPDFVSNPRWSFDGTRLCWLEWDHPNMPWDSNRLLVDGELVAGGPGESISQPRWDRDGRLWFISDRTGWWNLYRWTGSGTSVEPVVVIDAEIGVPQWVFGQSRDTTCWTMVVSSSPISATASITSHSGTARSSPISTSPPGSMARAHPHPVTTLSSSARRRRRRPNCTECASTPTPHHRQRGGGTPGRRQLGLDRSWFSVPESNPFSRVATAASLTASTTRRRGSPTPARRTSDLRSS